MATAPAPEVDLKAFGKQQVDYLIEQAGMSRDDALSKAVEDAIKRNPNLSDDEQVQIAERTGVVYDANPFVKAVSAINANIDSNKKRTDANNEKIRAENAGKAPADQKPEISFDGEKLKSAKLAELKRSAHDLVDKGPDHWVAVKQNFAASVQNIIRPENFSFFSPGESLSSLWQGLKDAIFSSGKEMIKQLVILNGDKIPGGGEHGWPAKLKNLMMKFRGDPNASEEYASTVLKAEESFLAVAQGTGLSVEQLHVLNASAAQRFMEAKAAGELPLVGQAPKPNNEVAQNKPASVTQATAAEADKNAKPAEQVATLTPDQIEALKNFGDKATDAVKHVAGWISKPTNVDPASNQAPVSTASTTPASSSGVATP